MSQSNLLLKRASDLCVAHKVMVQHNLVKWSQGNASLRVDHDTILIKASGITYYDLLPKHMVALNLAGDPVDMPYADPDAPRLKPSTDTASHLFIYQCCPEVKAIVHTHSPFATAFAGAGLPIPCSLTGIADEFGGLIPITSYASIGDLSIGHAVVGMREDKALRAVLLKSHGVLTVSEINVMDAVKAAVMVEDAAQVNWAMALLSRALRPLAEPTPSLPMEEILKNHTRYTTEYGQGR